MKDIIDNNILEATDNKFQMVGPTFEYAIELFIILIRGTEKFVGVRR